MNNRRIAFVQALIDKGVDRIGVEDSARALGGPLVESADGLEAYVRECLEVYDALTAREPGDWSDYGCIIPNIPVAEGERPVDIGVRVNGDVPSWIDLDLLYSDPICSLGLNRLKALQLIAALSRALQALAPDDWIETYNG